MTEHNSTFKPILKSVLVPLIFPVSAWWDRQFEQRFLEQNWCDTQWLLNMHIAVGLKVVVIPVLELLFHLKFSNDHAEGHLDWVSFWLHFMNTSKVEQTNAIVQLTVNQKVHWNFISTPVMFHFLSYTVNTVFIIFFHWMNFTISVLWKSPFTQCMQL